MSKYTYGTWTDYHGRWYARVSRINVSERTARSRARRAITREIQQREATRINPHPKVSLHLEPWTRDLDTVTFREKD